MEFGLSEIQLALQESLNGFLAAHCSLDKIRELSDPKSPFPDELWRGIAELGITGTIIPEEYGGVGLGSLDAAVVSESMGKYVVPLPFLASCIVAPKGILLAGSEQQKSKYLSSIASGEIRVGMALSEVPGARNNSGVVCENDSLSGESHYVTDPDSDKFLIADRDYRLYLVDAQDPGVTTTAMPQVDRTRKLCRLQLKNVNGELLPESDDSTIVQELMNWSRVMLAADTLGAAQEMLDQAIAYAMQREQFNRVIASFQAVKHMCAEMAAEIEPSRSLVWYAAHSLDELPDEAHLNACHAKAHLSEVGTFVAKTSTVVHGGMGFTDLLGLHYWFKRIGYNRQLLGGPELVREEAAQVQGFA